MTTRASADLEAKARGSLYQSHPLAPVIAEKPHRRRTRRPQHPRPWLRRSLPPATCHHPPRQRSIHRSRRHSSAPADHFAKTQLEHFRSPPAATALLLRMAAPSGPSRSRLPNQLLGCGRGDHSFADPLISSELVAGTGILRTSMDLTNAPGYAPFYALNQHRAGTRVVAHFEFENPQVTGNICSPAIVDQSSVKSALMGFGLLDPRRAPSVWLRFLFLLGHQPQGPAKRGLTAFHPTPEASSSYPRTMPTQSADRDAGRVSQSIAVRTGPSTDGCCVLIGS